jgi:hypothetical protein
MNVCFDTDDFVRECELDKGMALWRAELSDGSVVIQDDGRPGVAPQSAWLRLADYLFATKLRITKLWLGFRDNQQRDILTANAEGYFFCKSAIGMWGSEETLHFAMLGVLHSGKLRVQRWAVPELTLLEVLERDPISAGRCLIRNPTA